MGTRPLADAAQRSPTAALPRRPDTSGSTLTSKPVSRGTGRSARSGADGVFLGGILPDNGATLVRDLRAVLGPRFHILAPDGFEDFEQLIEEAGRAAEGVVVSVMVVPPRRPRPPRFS
jgi:hypothetical protein